MPTTSAPDAAAASRQSRPMTSKLTQTVRKAGPILVEPSARSGCRRHRAKGRAATRRPGPLQWTRGNGLRRIYRSSSSSREPLPEGKAHAPEVRQSTADQPRGLLDLGGRPPRRLAALPPHARLCCARAGEADRLIDTAERWLAGQDFELLSHERELVSLDDWHTTRSPRMRRVDEAIKAVVSETIPTLKDPRIGFVTVTGVVTTSDLAQATVWLSVYGGEKRRLGTLAALEGAAGILQARREQPAPSAPNASAPVRIRSVRRARRPDDEADRRPEPRPRDPRRTAETTDEPDDD